MRLVLATTNPGKIQEFEALLAPLNFQVVPQSQFTSQSVDETGLSFIENAILKARHASQAADLPAVADDSGLEVDALQGRPGIYSARYAAPGASDEVNLEKLLQEMRGVPMDQRGGRYWCALAYLRFPEDPAPVICQASWHGRILESPRGTGGFGYDPVFLLPELGLSAAELPKERKNEISHRGKAMRMLLKELQFKRAG
jgi:XTP/dITP diphosphohydrolase